MLKNPNRYSTLILQKGHQGCEIFYQIFPFSRHFAVQCKSFFFPLFFPTISLLSFQVVLSLKHLFYILRKFCPNCILCHRKSVHMRKKWHGFLQDGTLVPNVPTKLSESPYRKSFVVP